MNVIKDRNRAKNKARRMFPYCRMFEKAKWINCNIAKVSVESFMDTELADHLTRTDEPLYEKVNYISMYCEACGKCLPDPDEV